MYSFFQPYIHLFLLSFILLYFSPLFFLALIILSFFFWLFPTSFLFSFLLPLSSSPIHPTFPHRVPFTHLSPTSVPYPFSVRLPPYRLVPFSLYPCQRHVLLLNGQRSRCNAHVTQKVNERSTIFHLSCFFSFWSCKSFSRAPFYLFSSTFLYSSFSFFSLISLSFSLFILLTVYLQASACLYMCAR